MGFLLVGPLVSRERGAGLMVSCELKSDRGEDSGEVVHGVVVDGVVLVGGGGVKAAAGLKLRRLRVMWGGVGRVQVVVVVECGVEPVWIINC